MFGIEVLREPPLPPLVRLVSLVVRIQIANRENLHTYSCRRNEDPIGDINGKLSALFPIEAGLLSVPFAGRGRNAVAPTCELLVPSSVFHPDE